MITETEVEKALDYIRDSATRAAQSRANREYVVEFRKVIKAQIMRENQDRPIGVQESIAYSDQRYVQHLLAIKQAIEADEYQRWMLTAAEAKISAWQTQSRNTRVTL